MRHELLTAQELEDLKEIDVLLDEANTHANRLYGPGKSSEGNLSVDFGNHWDRDPDEERTPARVTIYAYLIGPHRNHYFDSTAEALETVRVWHENEMHSEDESYVPKPDPYEMKLVRERERAEASLRAFELLDED